MKLPEMKLITASILVLLTGCKTAALPDPNDKRAACEAPNSVQLAKVMWDRGVGEFLPSRDASKLNDMVTLINAGDTLGAARVATAQPGFINRTMFYFGDAISTLDNIPRGVQNSYVAHVQGVAMDNKPIQALFADGLYKVKASAAPNPADPLITTEAHWAQIQTRNLKASEVLEYQSPQWHSTLQTAANVPASFSDAAGLVTMSQFARETEDAGTNRKPIQFIMKNFLCRTLEASHDASVGDLYVARDVDRGDLVAFDTKCVGCHGQMDAMRGAFAFNDRVATNNIGHQRFFTAIRAKYANNSTTFPSGFVTTDTSWENLFVYGLNKEAFGWRGPANAGRGVASLMSLVGNAEAFTNCMVERAYKQVWLTDDVAPLAPRLKAIARFLETDNQSNFREIFAQTLAVPQCH